MRNLVLGSSSEERVDRVPNRKVSQELTESSVLGPHKTTVTRMSLKQESMTEEVPNSFTASSSNRLEAESRPNPE